MTKFAVIKTGGKQYLVKEGDEIFVEKINAKQKVADSKKLETVDLDKLAEFDSDKISVHLGSPLLKDKVQAQLVAQVKGDKVRVAKFKAKVRYRRVTGFRPKLTKLKITKI